LNINKSELKKNNNNAYCNNLFSYSRFITREVQIGDVALGGNNPIRIQSMTTTDTMNTMATVEQSIRMIEAGCEYVRITAPSINEAKNLENIKKELRKRGYSTPLIADIHFTPNAAEMAARIVEKVRVNPGNYADKKKFEQIDYSDSSYIAELERIRNRFVPLIKICKEYGTAMRVGTNHGSLSDRIMSRYGDTPLGMVESALEFVRICEEENYCNIVLSMKASNPQVMVQAYRLLVNKMIAEGMNYPLHLGVTEAGEGEDGRIKSASGIGTLLEDGLGDTIRVSLTEEPEYEIPVAKMLVKRYDKRALVQNTTDNNSTSGIAFSPFEYTKRETKEIQNIGGKNVPRVIADYSNSDEITPASFFQVGYNYSVPLDKWNLSDQACDYIFLGDNDISFEIPGTLGIINNHEKWISVKSKERRFPLMHHSRFSEEKKKGLIHPSLNFVLIDDDTPVSVYKEIESPVVFILETNKEHAMPVLRNVFFQLSQEKNNIPVIVKRNYQNLSEDEFQLYSSTDLGALLIDGYGDGVWLSAEKINRKKVNQTAFGILQATRTRISKTEYISCPSCGRTLFDLQETTAKIRAVTDHLKGVKIGIMGCIVNGPGEMADADYGYVGTGPGKISLYKGREVVQKNVPSEKAVEELVNLIKRHGDWVEKEVVSQIA
jgi:(E)-4-hydroxy-3-methylbut-2-enyl-diphosphate synthase